MRCDAIRYRPTFASAIHVRKGTKDTCIYVRVRRYIRDTMSHSSESGPKAKTSDRGHAGMSCILFFFWFKCLTPLSPSSLGYAVMHHPPSPIPPSTFTFTSTSTSSGLAQPFFPSPSASPRGCKVGSSNHIVSPSNRRSFYPPLIGRLLIAATHPPPPCMSPMIVRPQALISPSFLSFSFNLLPRQFARLT
jgi:hypothetical protein